MPKIEAVPAAEIAGILGEVHFALWNEIIATIDSLYDMNKEWYTGGKAAQYELKFRRGGKTLVSLFPKEEAVGLMIIFGKAEREVFEAQAASFAADTVRVYEEAKTYHDGKWVLYTLPAEDVLPDLPALLAMKRKPNRK